MVGSFGASSPLVTFVCQCANCNREERTQLPYQGFPSWFPTTCLSCGGEYANVLMAAVRPHSGWSKPVGFISAHERSIGGRGGAIGPLPAPRRLPAGVGGRSDGPLTGQSA